MTPRFHTSRPDAWTQPRQSRPADFGWGKIEPLLSDGWLPFRNTMILFVVLVWMTAGAIFLMVEF